jgi:hypothetical protein
MDHEVIEDSAEELTIMDFLELVKWLTTMSIKNS